MKRHVPAYLIAVGAFSVALAACADSTGPEQHSDLSPRVAVTQFENNRPVLLYGKADGSDRVRLRFDHVNDPIPGNFAGLVVRDENLLALGSPSIGGGKIAVVATLAHDQSEIVVLNADGTGGEVASINTQIIGSAPEWSPDGKKIAYTMSTLPLFAGLDLFVTDLETHTVTRLTTGGHMNNAAIAWSHDGKSIYIAHTIGTMSSPPTNSRSEILKVDVGSKAIETVASAIAGQVTSIAPGGNRFLISRNVVAGSSTTYALYEGTVVGEPEKLIVGENLIYARYAGGSGGFASVVTSDGTTRKYVVMHVSSKTTIAMLTGVADEANVDAYYVDPAVI